MRRGNANPVPRGPNPYALSQERIVGVGLQDIPLVAWKSSDGDRLVSLTGYFSGQGSFLATGLAAQLEMGAQLRYRVGGLEREDRFTWSSPGWRRNIVASEVSVVVQRRAAGFGASAEQVLAGASVGFDAGAPDELVQICYAVGVSEGSPTQTGFANATAVFPHGTKEFRVHMPQADGHFHIGTALSWPYGSDGSDFSQLPDTPNYNSVALADWTPVQACNAIRYIPSQDLPNGDFRLAFIHSRA